MRTATQINLRHALGELQLRGLEGREGCGGRGGLDFSNLRLRDFRLDRYSRVRGFHTVRNTVTHTLDRQKVGFVFNHVHGDVARDFHRRRFHQPLVP